MPAARKRRRKIVRLVDAPTERALRNDFANALEDHAGQGPIRGFLVLTMYDRWQFKTTTNWPRSRAVELVGILQTIQHARNREIL